MADKTKRRWFQFHLSTAVVMMMALSVLIGLNVFLHKPSPSLCLDFDVDQGVPSEGAFCYPVPVSDEIARGLPFISVLEYNFTDFRVYAREANELENSHFPNAGTKHVVVWCYKGLVANILLVVVLLASTTIGMEYIIRRREAVKQ